MNMCCKQSVKISRVKSKLKEKAMYRASVGRHNEHTVLENHHRRETKAEMQKYIY